MNKVYAIADIHGQYNLWRQIIETLDQNDILYVLGDCGDRGPDGWKIICEALRDPRVIYIRGNHEEMLLHNWRYDWCGEDFYMWQYNGGYETFENMLQDVNHQKYLIELAKTKFYHCYKSKNGNIIHLSHAGFTLMQNDAIPHKDDLLWDRDHLEDGCDWWPEENPNDYIVHGHTYCASRCFSRVDIKLNNSKTVGRYAHGHKICIDGRSFQYGKIAMLDLDTLEEIVFYN